MERSLLATYELLVKEVELTTLKRKKALVNE